jgi:hypothetical protein
MWFIVGFIVGVLVGICLPVVIACLIVASEADRELEDMKKRYDGW